MDSQESIVEVDNNSVMLDISLPNSPLPPPITGNVFQQIEQWEQHLSRFNINPPPLLFHNYIPERSQSSLSFVNDNNSAYSMTNKLGVQNGIVHTMRKMSRTEDTIRLSDTLKKRRSHSADSRFSHSMSVPSDGYQRLVVNLSPTPSTSRVSRFLSVSAAEPEIKIQVNGKGVNI